jgi:hypothetical protein
MDGIMSEQAREFERLQRSNKSMNKFLTAIAETVGTIVPKNAIDGINAAYELSERIIELAEIAKHQDELKRGNTALIIALMDMCQQHCSESSGLLCEDGLSSNEFAFSVLQEAGFVDEQAVGCYKLLWDKIRERDKLFSITVPK